MTGGTVIINGPTNDGNGALDYSGSFKITGGLLIAAGSSGMAMAPGQASTQYALMVNFEQAQSAGSIVHIENADGKNILTFAPAKNYQSVVLCSPQIQNGETCVVYTGGSSSGDVTDGLYSGGIYTGDTQIESFTISDMVTTVGSYSGGMGGFSGGPGGGGMMPGVPGGMAPDGTGSMPGGYARCTTGKIVISSELFSLSQFFCISSLRPSGVSSISSVTLSTLDAISRDTSNTLKPPYSIT
jgi:hypothetical protein